MIFRSRQRGIADNISYYIRQLVYFVHNLVNIYTIIICQLLVITISARVQELFIFFIFLWVQHIVAFLAKLYSNKSWPSIGAASIQILYLHWIHLEVLYHEMPDKSLNSLFIEIQKESSKIYFVAPHKTL